MKPKQGEFITYADGKDKKVQFKLQKIQRSLPKVMKKYSEADLADNIERIYQDIRTIFK